MQKCVREKLKKIRLLAMDVDGTLTDGTIHIGTDGELYKSFSVKDGLGIRLLRERRLIPAIMTSRHSKIVEHRAQELGILDVYQGVESKDEALKRLAAKHGLSPEQTAFIGDDLNDLEAMKTAGVGFAPADCAEEIRKQADIVLKARGGRGAVREAIDLILSAAD